MTQPIRIALVGLGNVGRAFLELMTTKRQLLRQRYGLELILAGVADSSGAAFGAAHLDPANVLRQKRAGNGAGYYPRLGQRGLAAVEMVRQVEADLLLEASPVNLRSGQPGLDCVRTALQRGMSAVLANKGPLVLAYRELADLACKADRGPWTVDSEQRSEVGGQRPEVGDQRSEAGGRQSAIGNRKSEIRNRKSEIGLRFSATVCGSLPVLNMGRRDLVACDIQHIEGIFNSTTNYILTAMESGHTFEHALREAQAEGVAEADPSLDVQGWDTANKLVIIANAVLDMPATLSDVDVLGIQDLTTADLAAARARGQAIKLVAAAHRQGDSYRLAVHPAALPLDHPLATTDGWEMGIVWETDIMGVQFAKVNERGPIPTAAAMLRDVIELTC
jgi:homoserine dehydrogenase